MQDLAEEEGGDKESASQRVVGTERPLSPSSFLSKFEPYEDGTMVLTMEQFYACQTYKCPLCISTSDDLDHLDEFRSLYLMCEHVKSSHHVTLYSSATYTCQQVLCGRLIKAAHLGLSKENQTFCENHPKERKIQRQDKGSPSAPYLITPVVPLMDSKTPVPPKLTPEPVTRGPVVRPEYPITSLAVHNLEHQRLARMSSVQEWAVRAAHGLLSSDTTKVLRQVDPIYSPVDLYPGPSGEVRGWWFAPKDAKMLTRLPGNKKM